MGSDPISSYPERSAIELPESRWADALRERALSPPPPADTAVLLKELRQRSAFYADRLTQSSVAGITAWSAAPILEKADVAAVPVADDGSVRDTRTSGTTGQQVTIRNTRREREFRRALLYRPQLFYELPNKVTQVVFVDGDWCASADDRPKRFAYGGVRYQTWFAGAAAAPAEVLKLLTTLKPQLVRGIASGIVRFIECVDRASLSSLGTRYVAPGGEVLLPEWRALMEDAFRATVLDRYGATESGALAWQCPECNAYHANTDEIIIEADPGGLLVTPLFVRSQPLLRYRLGDQIEFTRGAANCRIGLPTVRITQARRDDWLVDGKGQKVSPLSFQFERVGQLQAWRLHQRTGGELQLYFDGAAEAGPRLANAVRRHVPGRPVELIEGVWQLQRPGKFKRVSSDFPGGEG